MGTALLTWECGGGIGHQMNLRPIAVELVRRGHKVIIATRDLANMEDIFGGTGISYVPAPVNPCRRLRPFEPIRGFTHALGNLGFSDASGLACAFAAWNTLFDVIHPDLVVADHSPTALLALWGKPIRRVNVGLGFFCPPPGFPLPHWGERGGDNAGRNAQIAADETAITAKANQLLVSRQRPPLKQLCQIFTEIDEVFLATYPEFDHYGQRSNMRYWGHWPFEPGLEPNWPTGNGPKVYAYLKPFPGLEELLKALTQAAVPTIIFSGGIDAAMRARHTGPTLRFETRPLDLRLVAAQCDLAILNGTHGTAAAILLAGKPCLLVPLFLEQQIFSQRVEALGAGRVVPKEQGVPIGTILQDMLTNPRYRQGAETFAAHYTHMPPGSQLPELVDHLEGWIAHSRTL